MKRIDRENMSERARGRRAQKKNEDSRRKELVIG